MTTADACDLVVELTKQLAVVTAERDEDRLWLRAFAKSQIHLTRENVRLKELLRRANQEQAWLRQEILLKGEAA